jgi:hypothetical protein
LVVDDDRGLARNSMDVLGGAKLDPPVALALRWRNVGQPGRVRRRGPGAFGLCRNSNRTRGSGCVEGRGGRGHRNRTFRGCGTSDRLCRRRTARGGQKRCGEDQDDRVRCSRAHASVAAPDTEQMRSRSAGGAGKSTFEMTRSPTVSGNPEILRTPSAEFCGIL